jgi:hypothetical protein
MPGRFFAAKVSGGKIALRAHANPHPAVPGTAEKPDLVLGSA